MATSLIHTAFSAGEISPALYGRVDYQKLGIAASTLRNCFVNYRGGAYSRAGTAYVLQSLNPIQTGDTGLPLIPRVITFQFSISQGYALELGVSGADRPYMRFFTGGAPVVETAMVITAATQADPCQLTVPAHGYSENDWVSVAGVNGMTPLNSRTFLVHVVDANNISLSNLNGVTVDSAAYPAYISGGTTARIYTITTPWRGEDLPLLKFTQSADVMSFTHPDYAPFDLARISNNNWTLTASAFATLPVPPGSASAAASTHPSAATTPPTLPCAYAYVVTAVDIDGHESIASPIANVTDSVNMAVTAGSISVTWASVTAAVRYNIYRAPPSYNTATTPGGSITEAHVNTGGIDYAVNDTGFIVGGDNGGIYRVTQVDGSGSVLTFDLLAGGNNYGIAGNVATQNSGSQPGIGQGFTVVIVSVTAAGTSPSNALPVPVGAVFSYVGSSFGLKFIDSNIISDTTRSPPQHKFPFAPGQILNVVMTAFGSGYTTCDVSITSATGSGFQGLCVIGDDGSIQAVIIVQAGFAYGAPGETVVFSGNGAGAAATLTVGPQTGTYPGVVSYYQQRRVYAATLNQPDTYFMSKPGQFLNFDTSFPSSSADAITGTPWAVQINGIQWLIPMPGGLIAMTGKGAWQITGEGGSALNPQPITPSSQQAQPQQFNGVSASVPPIQVNYDILYVQAKGATVRDTTYNYITNNYTGTDQTALSSHLFSGYDVSGWAWCEEPYKIIWTVRCDGVLLSFTYLKEQEVYGWARHDTQGRFISVTSVTEPPVDALYCVVERITHYGLVYFIERMNDRIWTTSEDPWCVDSALQYPQLAPGIPISSDSTEGAVNFTASADAFPTTSVGSVLRVAGGIATISSYTDAQHVGGTWVLSPNQVVPQASL